MSQQPCDYESVNRRTAEVPIVAPAQTGVASESSGDPASAEAAEPPIAAATSQRARWLLPAVAAGVLAVGLTGTVVFAAGNGSDAALQPSGEEAAADDPAEAEMEERGEDPGEPGEAESEQPADVAPDSGHYQVVSAEGQDCLGVSSYQDPDVISTMDYMPVVTTTDCDGDSTMHEVEKLDEQQVRIKLGSEVGADGLCVSAETVRRDFIAPRSCDESAGSVEITVQIVGDDLYQFQVDEGCLAVSDGKTSAGYGLQLHQCDQTQAQQFELRRQ